MHFDNISKSSASFLDGISCVAILVLLVGSAGLARAAEIRGKVVDSNRGENLGRVNIAVLDTQFTARTSDAGEFVISGIPPGKYMLRIDAVGYRFLAVPFSLSSETEIKEFSVTLTVDGFRRSDVIVNVKGDPFHGEEAAIPSQSSLVGAEIKAAGTVLADDPFRAIQSLPGVSASENNEFFGQFTVLGAPFYRVGVYVDDVLVQQPFHGLPDERDGASLSLFSGETVEEVKLMPVAYPVKFADGAGAALEIRTRDGSRTDPLFRIGVGMAESSFLAEGRLGRSNRGSWLASARKSYLGYLTNYGVANASDVSFEDGDLKFTYDVTPQQSVDFYSISGHSDLNRSSPAYLNETASGDSNFTLVRAGWRLAATPRFLVQSHAAYIDQSTSAAISSGLVFNRNVYGELVGGTSIVWNWSKDNVFEGGWTGRGLRDKGFYEYIDPAGFATVIHNGNGTALRQSGYAQQAIAVFKDRLRVLGGVRWDRITQVGVTPFSPQASLSLRLSASTNFQFGFGRYAQMPDLSSLRECLPIGPLPTRSNQYTAALEQRIGEFSLVRVQAFDRENSQEIGSRSFSSSYCGPVQPAGLTFGKVLGHSRGVQVIVQRRSANRLSGWVGYALDYAQTKFSFVGFPGLLRPSPEDQRHSLNAFAAYRLAPSVNVGAKFIYGSGYPVADNFVQIGGDFVPTANPLRLAPYSRLDARIDKSLAFAHWKLTIHGEVLNLTNHKNLRFITLGGFNALTGQTTITTEQGLRITPTVGLSFEF